MIGPESGTTRAPSSHGLTRAQQRREATRENILNASRELVAESGFSAAQISQIAIRAGVAVGTIYKHFESRGELFGELYRVIAEHEFAVVAHAVELEHDNPSRIAAAVATFSTRALRAGRLAYALLAEPVEPMVDEHRLRLREGYRELFAKLITDGVAAGEISAPNIDVAAAALLGIMTESLVRPLQAHHEISDPTTLVAAVIRICLLSVGVPLATANLEADRQSASDVPQPGG